MPDSNYSTGETVRLRMEERYRLQDSPQVFPFRQISRTDRTAADQESDLDRQMKRLEEYAAARGLHAGAETSEIGSGLNGHRRKPISILADCSCRKTWNSRGCSKCCRLSSIQRGWIHKWRIDQCFRRTADVLSVKLKNPLAWRDRKADRAVFWDSPQI